MSDWREEAKAQLKAQIDRSRTPEFMERLRHNMEKHKPLLDRLEALEHEEQNCIVDAAMSEIRRLAEHEHRYPEPNDQGFPVDQCLDCGRWRESGSNGGRTGGDSDGQ